MAHRKSASVIKNDDIIQINMPTNLEYLLDNVWYAADYIYKLRQRLDYDQLVIRRTRYNPDEFNGAVEEEWFLGDKIHRLDGPAYIQKNIYGYIVYSSWHVHGKRIWAFDYWMDLEKNKIAAIFRYTKSYPELVDEIILISKHNKWLTDDQVLLLKNILLFNID